MANEEEIEEVSSDVVTLESYFCTECYDNFTEEDLHGNLNDCPTCGEKDVIMER